MQHADPITHTTRPIVTGTSVIAIKTDAFVMMAADTLGSYGSLARFHDIRRVVSVGSDCLLGAGGEISDFQKVAQHLEDLEEENYCYDDNVSLTAPQIHSYLTRICYNRRSKVDPFYNQFAVGGMITDDTGAKRTYLGYTDLFGTTFTDNYVATGFGAHLALPLLRKGYETLGGAQMTVEDARKLLADTMRVLFYRDCKTINRITFGTVDARGPNVNEPIALQTDFNLEEINPVKPIQNAEQEEMKVDD
eukprot:CAMPEP_0202687542 /NCGR_PEP_ID=MMETSP1385-20130828/3200_1 /ASSEMBLY_ACC=CAM_ASM_000861 /TAXON_ID=933848 /ORGANISM="Elphidium margaritaceum" /LENGTH=248 /DNA_ID=CAMNT_0049342355 /DNA_START=45 /DNA_END=791 /DNA_ORIENTATION=-